MSDNRSPAVPLKAMKFLLWLMVWALVGWWAWRVMGVLQRIVEGL